jgi:hypothetical protein
MTAQYHSQYRSKYRPSYLHSDDILGKVHSTIKVGWDFFSLNRAKFLIIRKEGSGLSYIKAVSALKGLHGCLWKWRAQQRDGRPLLQAGYRQVRRAQDQRLFQKARTDGDYVYWGITRLRSQPGSFWTWCLSVKRRFEREVKLEK